MFEAGGAGLFVFDPAGTAGLEDVVALSLLRFVIDVCFAIECSIFCLRETSRSAVSTKDCVYGSTPQSSIRCITTLQGSSRCTFQPFAFTSTTPRPSKIPHATRSPYEHHMQGSGGCKQWIIGLVHVHFIFLHPISHL